MKEDYVSFEIAKLLKEKGFPQTSIIGEFITIMVYKVNEDDMHSLFYNYPGWMYNKDKYIAAPTHQMAMAWLREKGIYINIFIDDDSEDPWTYNIFVRKDGKMTCAYHHHGRYFPLDGGYNIAPEEALKYCLENLI